MPIRATPDDRPYDYVEPIKFAQAIDLAWQNGAHVISNSWGYENVSDPNDPLIAVIRDAINRALTQGRNGKGCIVVASAGNAANRGSGQYHFVEFPANMSGVIAVGAINLNNGIQNYSPRDQEMAVVAPSGLLTNVLSAGYCEGDQLGHQRIQLLGNLWTMDIGSSSGYNPGTYNICQSQGRWNKYLWTAEGGTPTNNYTANFGGTSAACPQVAGVAALILSLNPNLTYTQVSDIIKQTADDLGVAGWDSDYGHGRLNAYKAVAKVHSPVTTAPVYNTYWCQNSQQTIRWTSSLNTTFQIRLSTDGGATFPTVIASSVGSSMVPYYSFVWNLSEVPACSNARLVVIDNGQSAYRDTTDEFVIATPSAPTPGIPGNFKVTNYASHPLVSWTKPSNAGGYEVWRASSELEYLWFNFKKIDNPDVTSWWDEIVTIGASNPHTMKYKVRASNGCSSYSGFTVIKSIQYSDFIKRLVTSEDSTSVIFQNYPNPFNPSTTISFYLPAQTLTTLQIYNMMGQEVRTLVSKSLSEGSYEIFWDGKDNRGREIASGIYIYRLQAGSLVQSKKMNLIK